MKIIYDVFSLKEKLKNSYIAIGNFDGVHIGHKELIKSAVNSAKRHSGVSVIFTFYNHPREVIEHHETPKLINSVEEKSYLLEKLGVDYLVLQPFNKEFCNLSAEEFIEKVMKQQLNSKEIFVGFNFGFGKNRSHGVKELEEICEHYKIKVREIQPIKVDEKVISSTLIRKLILNGDLPGVNHLLGEPLTIIGEVIHGKKLGRTIGFPTANLERKDKAYLPYGIYGAVVKIENENKEYDAVVNIGKNPTLKPGEKSIEVHILNFSGDLYGKKLIVQLIKHIREEMKFSGIDSLKEQITKDIIEWKNYLVNLEKGNEDGTYIEFK
ncbi:MAG: bifunctional riboflavin kinase/FAD synthetase [Fusobacteriaceae bacterium]